MRRTVGAAVASVLVLGSLVEELVLVEVEELELELEVEVEELLLELDELLLELLLLMVAFIAEASVVVLLAVGLLAAVDNETGLSVVTFVGKVVFPNGSMVVGLSVVVEFSVSVSRKFIKTSINFKMEPRSSVLKVCALVSPISHAPQAKPNSSTTTNR